MNQGLTKLPKAGLELKLSISKAATITGLGHQVWPRNCLYYPFRHSLSCCVLHSLCACHFNLSFPLLISLPVLFVLLSIQVYGVYTLSVEFSSVSQAESLPLPDLSLPLNFPTSLSSPSTVLWVSERPTTLKPQPRLAFFCGSWYCSSHSSDSLEYFGIVFGSNGGEPEYAFPCPLAKLQIAKPLLNPSFLPQRNTIKFQTLSLLPCPRKEYAPCLFVWPYLQPRLECGCALPPGGNSFPRPS